MAQTTVKCTKDLLGMGVVQVRVPVGFPGYTIHTQVLECHESQ